jgi:hypothetical protein
VVVPFPSIKSFVDPSVQFGVQFETLVAAEDGKVEGADAAAPGEPNAVPPTATVPTPANPPTTDEPATASKDSPTTPAGGGQVVSLDRFRKK